MTNQTELFQKETLNVLDIMFNFPKKEHELIKKEKRNIENKHGEFPRSASLPHISLCSFVVTPERTEKVLHELKEKLSSFSAVEVSLNGFEVFSNNVIYAKIEPQTSFTPFYTMLKFFRKDKEIKEKNFKVSENPHATLVRVDDNMQFAEISKEYESKNLKSTFLLDKLVIRKNIGGTDRYEYEYIILKK